MWAKGRGQNISIVKMGVEDISQAGNLAEVQTQQKNCDF